MNRIIFNIQKFVVKKVKNQHVLNGRTEFMVMIIELLRFQSRNYLLKNHLAKFEIDRTILTCLNEQKKLTVMDGRSDLP